MCPTALPVHSSFSSPQDPRGQSRRGFCDLFFSIAEGSVVQKWSRPSSSPNLVKQNILHTRTYTHTPTHTHTHTSSSFSNTPIETDTHTHNAQRCSQNYKNLLRAGTNTSWEPGVNHCLPTQTILPSWRRAVPAPLQTLAASGIQPAWSCCAESGQHPSFLHLLAVGVGVTRACESVAPKMKRGESYHIINSFCKLIQSLKEFMNSIPSHSQGKWA